MPEIQIRPAEADDIPALVALDHSYSSDSVWQMDFHTGRDEDLGMISVQTDFRPVRLPRLVKVEYPRSPQLLEEDWSERAGILVAILDGRPVGYAALSLHAAPQAARVTDLVVDRPVRRQGIATALVLASLEWATNIECQNLVLEAPPRDYPAIQLAFKLGFDFCGYNDRLYPNQETGVFFGKALH